MREDGAMSLGHRPGPLRIVIADDDPLLGRMLQAHLSERADFEVVGLAGVNSRIAKSSTMRSGGRR